MRSMSWCLLWVALGAVTMAHPACAQTFYKCISPQGKPEFSDQPCAASTRQEKLQPRDNTLDTSGLREQHLIQENQQLRQELDNERSSRRQMPSEGRTPSDLQAERADSIACQRARRDLEIAANSISPNRNTIQARRSAMYGTCGMKELPQVTIINNPTPYSYRRP